MEKENNKMDLSRLKVIVEKVLRNPTTLVMVMILIVVIVRVHENKEIASGKYNQNNVEVAEKMDNYFNKEDVENKKFVPEDILKVSDYKYDKENKKISYKIKNVSDKSIFLNHSAEYMNDELTLGLIDDIKGIDKKPEEEKETKTNEKITSDDEIEIKGNNEIELEIELTGASAEEDFIKDGKEREDVHIYKNVYTKEEKEGYRKIGIIQVK